MSAINTSDLIAPTQQPADAIAKDQLGRKVEIISSHRKEESFSATKYLIAALAIAGVAAAVFPFCFPASIVLIAIASWYLWSAAIVALNRVAEGTRLEKPINLLHALAMEVNAGVAATALFPFTLFDRYHLPRGELKGQPILMVNGYLSFGSTWHYQRERLIQEGLGPIYTMNVGSGRSITTYAGQIQEKVRKIQQETGRKDLILIGHSKGGLVSSYFATHLAKETEADVTDVITIGSPLAGTTLAYLGIGHDAYEMRSDGEFNRTLRNRIKEHPQIRFSHIASEADEVVPLSSALLGEDRTRQMVLKDMGHLGLVFSSRVGDQLCAWLKPTLIQQQPQLLA